MPLQPEGEIPLPDGWELASDYDGKPFYIDHNSRQTSWIDPRDRLTKPHTFADCVGDELPLGWEETQVRDGEGTYYINHLDRETQVEDPRQQWRTHQEYMLKEYLVTANENLEAKKEICTVKEERLRLAQDEYQHLNESVGEWKSSTSLNSTSSTGSTKYDPDLLKADVVLARSRVSRLKRELEQANAEVHYKERGVEALSMVDQKMCHQNQQPYPQQQPHHQQGDYNINQQRAIVEKIRSIQHSLSMGQQERDVLLQSLAQLKDDILLRRVESGSSPDVSLIHASHERFSTASQTDLSGEGISTGARLAEIARMRLQYDEAKKAVKNLSQELAEAIERDMPGQHECDKDRLLLIQEKEQLLRELRSINPDGRSGAEIASIQVQITQLEHSIGAAMATSSQQIAHRLKVQEHKETTKRKLDEAVRLTTYLESQLKSLSLSTLSSGSSLGSLGSLSASSRASLNSLTYPDVYAQPRSLETNAHDLNRIYQVLQGQCVDSPGEELPPSYEQHMNRSHSAMLPQIKENVEELSASTASLPQFGGERLYRSITSSVSLPGLPQLNGTPSVLGSTQSLPQILEHPRVHEGRRDLPAIVRAELPRVRLMEGSIIQKLTQSVDPQWHGHGYGDDDYNSQYYSTNTGEAAQQDYSYGYAESGTESLRLREAHRYRQHSSQSELPVPFSQYTWTQESETSDHLAANGDTSITGSSAPASNISRALNSARATSSSAEALCSSAPPSNDVRTSNVNTSDTTTSDSIVPPPLLSDSELRTSGSRSSDDLLTDTVLLSAPTSSCSSTDYNAQSSALIPLITEVDNVPTLQYLDPRTGEVVRSQTIYTKPDERPETKVVAPPLSPLSETSSGMGPNLSGGNTRSVSAAVSDESVAGDSGVFEASGKKSDEGEDSRPAKTVDCAQLLLRLRYETEGQALNACVQEGRNLLALFPEENGNIYIKVALLPASDLSHQFTTSTSGNINSPKFYETYRFTIEETELYGKTLQANVWCTMREQREECLGSVQVSLADFDSSSVLTKWYNVLSFKFMQSESAGKRAASASDKTTRVSTPPSVQPASESSSRASSASSTRSRRESRASNPAVSALIEESSDESTVVSSQTSTLTRDQGPDELDFPAADKDTAETPEDESTDSDRGVVVEEDTAVALTSELGTNLAEVVERLAKTTKEDELDNASLSPNTSSGSDNDEVQLMDKETNTESAFRCRTGNNNTQASVRRSQTFSPTVLRPDTRRCKLNRHGSDSAVPRFRRGPFQRNTVERRTLRRKKSLSSLKDLPLAMERQKPGSARMRTSLDLELDLQASQTKLEQLNDDIGRLRRLVTCMQDARDNGEGELPSWFTDNEQLQLLLTQAESLHSKVNMYADDTFTYQVMI